MGNPEEFAVAVDAGQSVTALHYAADSPARGAAVVFAHGAGAGQRSPFIVKFARGLASRGLDVVTFNFLYTEQRRRLPDRAPALEACYRAVVAATVERVPTAKRWLFIGGKSMGGRIATHIAALDAGLPIAGLVLLGYPLHPPGKPEKRRDAHLPAVGRAMLFVQGSRDTFGTPEELRPILEPLCPSPTLHVVEGGDHSFKVPRTGAAGQAEVDERVMQTTAEWIEAVTRTR